MISPHSIAQLRNVPLPTLVADYVPLKKSGHRYTGSCPFHQERTASFTVYSDHFYCFGCSARGSAIDFIMRVEHLPFPRAAEAVAARFGVNLDLGNLTRPQALYAAHEADFCKFWWERFESDMLAQMHASMDGAIDQEGYGFAGTVSRILAHFRSMKLTDRYRFFQANATVRDRREWEESREWERAFEAAWLGMSKQEWRAA
jgi:DNA primase